MVRLASSLKLELVLICASWFKSASMIVTPVSPSRMANVPFSDATERKSSKVTSLDFINELPSYLAIEPSTPLDT